MYALLPWLQAAIRSRLSNERGQTEIIVLALIIFLLWIIATGRKVVVQ